MNKRESLQLIEGTFTDDEANEILMNIFLTKINFHEMKDFSSHERFGKQDEIALKRIPALKTEIQKLKKILLEAKAQNKKLAVSSEIIISLP
jgi:hypothetical protein